jgi:acyl-CoA thioesterase FadM
VGTAPPSAADSHQIRSQLDWDAERYAHACARLEEQGYVLAGHGRDETVCRDLTAVPPEFRPACGRPGSSVVVTAAVDGLQFLHPIKIGDLIILRAVVTAAFTTSLEVMVEVFSEGTLTGERRLTCIAYLTFVTVDRDGGRIIVPPLLLETDEARERARDAEGRRAARLEAKRALS